MCCRKDEQGGILNLSIEEEASQKTISPAWLTSLCALAIRGVQTANISGLLDDLFFFFFNT